MEKIYQNPNLTVATDDIENITNDTCNALECGDIVRKVIKGGKFNTYLVAHKEDEKMSFIRSSADGVEEIKYKKVNGRWAYDETTTTEMPTSEQIAWVNEIKEHISYNTDDDYIAINSDVVVVSIEVGGLQALYADGQSIFPDPTNQAGKVVKVKGSEDGFEYGEVSGGGTQLYEHHLILDMQGTACELKFITNISTPFNALSSISLIMGIDFLSGYDLTENKPIERIAYDTTDFDVYHIGSATPTTYARYGDFDVIDDTVSAL